MYGTNKTQSFLYAISIQSKENQNCIGWIFLRYLKYICKAFGSIKNTSEHFESNSKRINSKQYVYYI